MANGKPAGAERGLTRFESFTDAVFAIGITLLIVQLPTPGAFAGPAEPQGLAAALAAEWRAYLALGVSFAFIGTYWLNHHYSGRLYRRTDHWFSLLNLVFIGGVVFSPWPIRIWTEHLGQPEDSAVAARLLAWALVAPSVGWLAKWMYAAGPGDLIDDRLEPAFVRRMTIQYAASTLAMLGAAGLSLVYPDAGLAAGLTVTALYVLPPPAPRYRDGEEPDEAEVEAEG